MDARIHETDTPAQLESEETHGAIVAQDSVVGTGGFEPPTPSVSGKCSTTELRAFVASPSVRGGSVSRKLDPVTNIRWWHNQALRVRPHIRYLLSSAANGGRNGSRTNRAYFLLRLPGGDGLRALPV